MRNLHDGRRSNPRRRTLDTTPLHIVDGDVSGEALDGTEMAFYQIEGGVPLRGEVQLSGAKNAATKLMVASLLTDDRCEVRNAPRGLGDLIITEEVLRALGAGVSWVDEHTVAIRAADVASTVVPLDLG